MPGLTNIDLTCVDDRTFGLGTFQSNNQKVVSNRNGIFMTYIKTRNEPYTAQMWRLLRSTDGGNRFSTVYEATDATNPPVLETDEADNLYLARPDFVDGHAYLYRFQAADGYARPLISKIEGGSAGKYCMMYDRDRAQLYYFAHNGTFHVVGLDGTVRSAQKLLVAGQAAVQQYPLLSLDLDGTLHAAWTTVKHGVYLYWDIHYMRSRDGGKTWEKMDGAPLTPPVVADHGGPADQIILEDEFEFHTWLSSFMVKNGKLHFIYRCAGPDKGTGQHYVRYDLGTGRRDLDIWPVFRGQEISLCNLDGFFASRASEPGSPLYCILAQEGRIACLASDDNGETWYDYTISEKPLSPYAIGGCREVTAAGQVIGSFCGPNPDAKGDAAPVYFMKFQAGLTR
ncbi:MAG: hypothetical protein EXS64_06900 [Candidatus Latescibacteria bacterium]|nr:hypothetical protein [Candidatus Latescibacterota bacterium]